MKHLTPFTSITSNVIADTAKEFGTPVYLYDERFLVDRCQSLLHIPHAYGLTVRYAMKANSTKALLNIIASQGLKMDASSLSEAKRAHMAGIAYEKIILTTQEVPLGDDRAALEEMMLQGLKYNVCSMRQLELIADFAAANRIALSMRVHPGMGAGESASRNTGDDYSCFGVHLKDIEKAMALAAQKGIQFTQMHEHIGSGGDAAIWQQNVDLQLSILEKHFPHAATVSFGGGLKEARVPGEKAADPVALGAYAKKQLEAFYKRTGRKLQMEIEPGTFVMANAGYIITKVMDKKQTNAGNFIIADGGMEVNARPLCYGSRHPFYVISKKGELLSSAFDAVKPSYTASLVGKCCESGDSQCLDESGKSLACPMAEPEIGDYVAIGGAGAYCSAMTPFNYNSHVQAPEVLYQADGQLRCIRKKQSLEQIIANEL